jgi:hypothetical protein
MARVQSIETQTLSPRYLSMEKDPDMALLRPVGVAPDVGEIDS